MMLGAAALEEKEALRLFMLARLRAGVDSRALAVGHAAMLGMMAGRLTISPAHLDTTLQTLGQVMRESAQIEAPAVGHG